MKIVTFQIANEMYGIPIDHVQSIEVIQPIRKVPLSGKGTIGIMNLRGVITTVKDIRILLGLQRSDITEQNKLIVSDHNAYLVDTVENIVECNESAIQQVNHVESKHIKGVLRSNEQLIMLLEFNQTTNVL